jgi:hypothetical protein
MIIFGVQIFLLILSISNFVKSNNLTNKIEDDQNKNKSSFSCDELIDFVNESENIHGYLTLKGVDPTEGFNITVEFGIKKGEMELNKNYYPFVEFVESDDLPAILDVNFGFTKPVPELVSLKRADVMLCEKGRVI